MNFHLIFTTTVFLVSLITATHAYLSHCFTDEDFSILWSKHIGLKFVASPVVGDYSPDAGLEIVAQTGYGDLAVLHAATGNPLKGSHWPVKVPVADSNIHAGPLMYDVNRDGIQDVVVVSTRGEIHAYSIHGKLFTDELHRKFNYRLSDVFIRKRWFEEVDAAPVVDAADLSSMDGLIREDVEDFEQHGQKDYVRLQPYVYATPVLEDVNGDDIVEELIIPVTYQVSQDALDADIPPDYHPDDYLVSAVVQFNLTAFAEYGRSYTELGRRGGENPPYALTSPLVVSYPAVKNTPKKHDKNLPRILLPTTGTRIRKLHHSGEEWEPAFMTHGVNVGVIAEDLSYDERDRLEFVYAQGEGSVVCMDSHNAVVWETSVKAEVTGMKMFERKTVDGVLIKLIVIATTAGKVWILNGKDGKSLPRWPMKFGKELKSPPNIIQFVPDGQIYIAALDVEGFLHLITVDQSCKLSIQIGETTVVGLVAADLDPGLPGAEILVATTHGTLIAIGFNRQRLDNGEIIAEGVTDDMYNTSLLTLVSWLGGDGKSHNVFLHTGHVGCLITQVEGHADGKIDLQFSIFDHLPDVHNPSRSNRGVWSCGVYVGNTYVANAITSHDDATMQQQNSHNKNSASAHVIIGSHSISFQTDKIIQSGSLDKDGDNWFHIELRCHQNYHQLYSHVISYQISQGWSHDLMLLFILPVLFMLLVFFVDGLMANKSGPIITGQHLD